MSRASTKKTGFYPAIWYGHAFFFWPLIIAGGRLVFRVIFNTWDMLED